MYLKRTLVYGNRIEVRKYHTSKYGAKGEKRSKRTKPTPEQVKAYNERQAIKKLTRLIIGNFTRGDVHLTLTYTREQRPDAEGSRILLGKFLRKLRAAYRKMGYELKYIIVTEWESKSIHHHMILNSVPELMGLLAELWSHGGTHITPLYADQDYEGLAKYLVKETKETFRKADNPYRQRWTASRNLKKPEEKIEVVKADSWREEPKTPKSLSDQGYALDKDSVYTGFDIFGYPFIEYTFRRWEQNAQRANKQEKA